MASSREPLNLVGPPGYERQKVVSIYVFNISVGSET